MEGIHVPEPHTVPDPSKELGGVDLHLYLHRDSIHDSDVFAAINKFVDRYRPIRLTISPGPPTELVPEVLSLFGGTSPIWISRATHLPWELGLKTWTFSVFKKEEDPILKLNLDKTADLNLFLPHRNLRICEIIIRVSSHNALALEYLGLELDDIYDVGNLTLLG